MGLITGFLTLPLAPVRGVAAVAEQIQRQALEEYYDPVRIREQLTAVQRRREQGELTDAEAKAFTVEKILAGNDGWKP